MLKNWNDKTLKAFHQLHAQLKEVPTDELKALQKDAFDKFRQANRLCVDHAFIDEKLSKSYAVVGGAHYERYEAAEAILDKRAHYQRHGQS